jgi:hypothetical protein
MVDLDQTEPGVAGSSTGMRSRTVPTTVPFGCWTSTVTGCSMA